MDAHSQDFIPIVNRQQVESEGESFKLKTRNYPIHQQDVTRAGQTTPPTAETISELYTTIGRTLTSPAALSGLLTISTAFDKKADKVTAVFKGKWIKVVIVLCIIGALFSFSAIPYYEGDTTLYALIPLFASIGVLLVAVTVYSCIIYCSCGTPLSKKLLTMEKYLSLCEISNQEFDQLFEETDYGVCDYKVVGSAGDGFGFFPFQGSNKHLAEKKSVLTQDIDLNIFLNVLQPTPRNLVPVPEAKGFTWIALTEEEKDKITDPVLQACLFPSTNNAAYYLSAANISREVIKYFPKDNQNTTVTEHFPALTVTTEALGPNGKQKYEVDYAFALRYAGWPEDAQEWLTRERYGLDPVTVRQIVSRGCYLVHKQCGQRGHENHEYDWRYTFASAEADLFHYHRDKLALKLAFVILKFVLKMSMKRGGALETFLFTPLICLPCQVSNWISQETECPVLRTYHLKTVFLWMAEQETDLDYYTIKGNKTLGEVFMAMVDFYLDCVNRRELPNYFMRDRNMLSGTRYQDEHFIKAKKLLVAIKKRPAIVTGYKFERQFVNKRKVMILLIVLFIFYGVAQIIRDLPNSSGGNVVEPTSSSYLDFNNTYFTPRYLEFLRGLCVNNNLNCTTHS